METKLDIFRRNIRIAITDEMMKDWVNPPDISFERGFDIGQYVIYIVQRAVAQKLQEYPVSYPADWWQAFKERWFPAWVKRRWPVKYTRYTIKAWEVYPRVLLPPHDEFKYVYRVLTEEWGSDV